MNRAATGKICASAADVADALFVDPLSWLAAMLSRVDTQLVAGADQEHGVETFTCLFH